jgi:type II secretion system protein N
VKAKAPARPQRQPLRTAAIATAAVLLTAFFAYLRFPYDRLAESLSARIERDTGLRVEIGRLSASPQLAGPGIAAQDVRITRADGSVLRVDRLRIRPAWSLTWLTARPAFHVDAEAPLGGIDGVAVLWGPPRFTGTLRDIDLAELSDAVELPGTRIEGHATLDLDLARTEEGPAGPVQIAAKDGVLSHPRLPMAVPYEELHGSLQLGGDTWVQIGGIDVRSPLGTGTLKGTIGRAADATQAPLALEVAIQVSDTIRSSLTSQGVRVGRDGELHFQVTGTAGAPIVQ